MEEKIREKIETLRAMLQQDGGDCEIVKIDRNAFRLR